MLSCVDVFSGGTTPVCPAFRRNTCWCVFLGTALSWCANAARTTHMQSPSGRSTKSQSPTQIPYRCSILLSWISIKPSFIICVHLLAEQRVRSNTVVSSRKAVSSCWVVQQSLRVLWTSWATMRNILCIARWGSATPSMRTLWTGWAPRLVRQSHISLFWPAVRVL